MREGKRGGILSRQDMGPGSCCHRNRDLKKGRTSPWNFAPLKHALFADAAAAEYPSIPLDGETLSPRDKLRRHRKDFFFPAFGLLSIWAIYLYKGRELLHPRRGLFLRKWGQNEKKRSQILKNSESDFAFSAAYLFSGLDIYGKDSRLNRSKKVRKPR